MFTFTVNHKSGDCTQYPGIKRVEYSIAGMDQVVEGNDIATHKFPMKSDLYLFADDSTSSINSDDVSSIIVDKE